MQVAAHTDQRGTMVMDIPEHDMIAVPIRRGAHMAKHPTTITISERAVEARVRRALEKRKQTLRTDRRRGKSVLMVIDDRQSIIAHGVTLAALARELGVLRPYERLAD